MNHFLSIIIPCYNCESTLAQAVESIYKQGLSFKFEIILIDDASTDETYSLMQSLAKNNKHMKVFKNVKNEGGGATRNRGIRESKGDLIFCLDSDNFLAQNALLRLIECLDMTKAPGVAVHNRRYFYKTTLITRSHFNPILREGIVFSDLFSRDDVLLDNFLFTRKAFDETAGYPEHHGFDTQGFEVRFLSKGFRVAVARDSMIYHRQGDFNRSYFEREYESGEFSKNMLYIYEEVLPFFSKEVRQAIVNYDVFSENNLESNLAKYLIKSYRSNPNHFFSYPKEKVTDPYWKAWNLYMQEEYEKSISLCESQLKSENASSAWYFLIMRCLVGISGAPVAQREKEASKIIAKMLPPKRQSMFRTNVAMIGVKKVRRLFEKYL